LLELKTKLAQGNVEVKTELENIMQEEAMELISKHYDNVEGAEELYAIIRRRRMKGKGAPPLLTFTTLEQKYKLSKMPRTAYYTKGWNLWLHYIELFFQIMITQTNKLVYIAMIFSMFENQGIVSFFYPFMVFGYALLEETRPT
jgi:hypothetical protein